MKGHIQTFNTQKKEFLAKLRLESETKSKDVRPSSTASTPADEKAVVLDLENPFLIFKRNVLKQILTSLENHDYKLTLLAKAMKDSNFEQLIKSILATKLPKEFPNRMDFSPRKIDDLFNSKHFNLGCSEQLILHTLSDGRTRAVLKKEFLKVIDKGKALKWVIFHIHSTKTPCKACLINCCGHLEENGWLRIFFDELSKQLPVPMFVFISYHDAYADQYNFGIKRTDVQTFFNA